MVLPKGQEGSALMGSQVSYLYFCKEGGGYKIGKLMIKSWLIFNCINRGKIIYG
jgi:hypothetical protein